ncbi:MAG TPA: phosphoenolpyruvate--protein phosphotransferase, partial [Ruminococcaceae bacterium]|nr:phosphoenolpyruvate--protein phosphotransferase [Oscillospiraceae bacterium]
MKELQGIGASEGIAIGRLGWMESGEDTVEKKGITDVAGELSRLDAAREETIRQLQSIYVDALKKLPEKDSMIFQIHIMMMQDEDFTEAMRQAVRTEKVCAEYAVWEAGRTFSERFAKMDNEYMRGRAQDV